MRNLVFNLHSKSNYYLYSE